MRVFHVSATTTSTRVGWRFSSSEPPTAAFSFDIAVPSKTNVLTRAPREETEQGNAVDDEEYGFTAITVKNTNVSSTIN